MASLDLRALLELRTAAPADIDGETLLLRCDLPGTMQLFRVPLGGGALEQLTEFRDPVEGQYVTGSAAETSICFWRTLSQATWSTSRRTRAKRSTGSPFGVPTETRSTARPTKAGTCARLHVTTSQRAGGASCSSRPGSSTVMVT